MKIKLKTKKLLRKYGRHVGGDMSTTLEYRIDFNGNLIPTEVDCDELGGFHVVYKDVLENGEEFLVVDHPNIITKQEYEMSKSLYDVIEED